MFNRNDSKYSVIIMLGIGLIVAGVGAAILGLLMFFASGGPGIFLMAVIAPILLAIGLIMLAVVLLRAVYVEKQGSAGAMRIENGAWVQARFAIMPGSEEMIFSEDFFDADMPGVRLFVRLKYPDGRVDEPKTSIPVWRLCGEGQVGVAEIQGDWLVRFTAQPRPTGPPRA